MKQSEHGHAWRWARIVGANVALVVVLLAALELASRQLVPTALTEPLIVDRFESWLSSRELDPLLFWRLSEQKAPDGTVIINELGWRGAMPGAKEADEYRILSLGESTTSAVRVPFEQTYSSVLERELGSFEGRRVRVINAGSSGYTLAQGVALLRRDGLPLEPDMVLTYFGNNDFMRVAFRARRDAAFNDSSGLTDLELQRRRRRSWARIVFWLHGQSNFVRWLQRPAEELTVRLGRGPRVPLEDRRLLYDELRRLCSENGVRLVVAVPIYREFDRHAVLLRELSASGELEVIDLPAMLELERETPADRRALFFDKVHPRAELHQRIGVAVAGFLAANAAASGLER